jgi:hypothetical protein
MAFVALLGLTLTTVACNPEPPTFPTSATTTATTVAEATVTEEFTGILPVGGSSFYSFTTTLNGTVNLTLAQVSGASVPATVWLGVGIGVPNAEDCATTNVVNTAAGTGVHLTGTFSPGVYCARVHDIGNLFAPANFTVTIAHPE